METYEIAGQENKFYFSQYNEKAKKATNRLMHTYYFRNAESRDKYVSNLIANIQCWEDRKQARKQAKKDFFNPAKIGDILVDSWGYDQTNVDFYQVTGVGKKSVKITPISSRITDQTTGNSMAAYVMPVRDAFVGKSLTKMALPAQGSASQYYVNTKTYSSAQLWNGNPMYNSWYA